MHCPYLNISQPEYAIFENQKIHPLAVRQSLYLKFSQFEKPIPEHYKIGNLEGRSTHSGTFPSLKP